MRCLICKKGDTAARLISEEVQWRDEWFYFKNVPVEVCAHCGERYYKGKVIERMEEIMKETYFQLHPDAPRYLPVGPEREPLEIEFPAIAS